MWRKNTFTPESPDGCGESGCRRVSRATYFLLNHHQSISDFRQHQDRESIPAGFSVSRYASLLLSYVSSWQWKPGGRRLYMAGKSDQEIAQEFTEASFRSQYVRNS